MGIFDKLHRPTGPIAAIPEKKEIAPKIGENQVNRASDILRKYKAGKARLEAKIVANEEFWKLRQWQYIDPCKAEWSPATPWLWTCIQARHSDTMDAYPSPNIRPRQSDDEDEAKKLSAIIPVILEENRFEETYSDVAWYTLKHGGGAFGIFWDARKHNGIGDITCRKIDLLNLFWEPGITDIQDSANVFHCELTDNSVIEQRYPQAKGRLGGQKTVLARYLYDDTVDTSEKSVVVDWYYHSVDNGVRKLQYCKYVNGVVLYASENDTTPREQMPGEAKPYVNQSRGWYEHGMYPFVVFPLFPVEGSLCGYGLTDIGRDTQIQIDKLNCAITKNAEYASTPRYFKRNSGGVNEDEFNDLSKSIIHVEGNLGDDNIRPVNAAQLSGTYVDVLNMKIEELKYCTSNQDANNGVAPSGITAASALAALQETAGKNSRDSNKTFYRAYRDVIYQVVELIRQFYDVPRTFRLCPESGKQSFVSYSNAELKGQQQANTLGQSLGLRLPEFDIEVSAEKANPYKKMEINELAMRFYSSGLFNPQMTDQAIACLQMMDFAGKEDIMSRISKNGTLYQKLLQTQQLLLKVAQQADPATADVIAKAVLAGSGNPIPAAVTDTAAMTDMADDTDDGHAGEHPVAAKARAQARASTQPE